MKKHPAIAAAILAGLFAIGTAVAAYPAGDNTAKPKVPFDHKSLGKDSKDCEKCHKLPAPAQK